MLAMQTDRNTSLGKIRMFMVLFLGLILYSGILMGCGSSDSGGGDKVKSSSESEEVLPPAESTEGSSWDAMKWDQGDWG